MRGPRPVGEEVGVAREARWGVPPATEPRRGPGKKVLRAAMVAVLVPAAGCPPAKPDVALPPLSGSLELEVVAALGPAEGLSDVRALALTGTVLLVGDAEGLFLFDVADPTGPQSLASMRDRPVDEVTASGPTAFTIDVAGSHVLRAVDLSDPAAPRTAAEVDAVTLIFGGLAVDDGLLWHAVGSNPPSRLHHDLGDLSRSCDAPDRERGAMDIWLHGDLAFEAIHFDDFAGDELDGNGAFGIAVCRVERGGDCPDIELADVLYADTHDQNRSAFERASASDLQVWFDGTSSRLYATGEQRLRSLEVASDGQLSELDALDLPEALGVAGDPAGPAGTAVAVTNGDLLLVDAGQPDALELAAILETPGVTRAILAAGDGAHFFAGDSEGGVLVVRYGVAP